MNDRPHFHVDFRADADIGDIACSDRELVRTALGSFLTSRTFDFCSPPPFWHSTWLFWQRAIFCIYAS